MFSRKALWHSLSTRAEQRTLSFMISSRLVNGRLVVITVDRTPALIEMFFTYDGDTIVILFNCFKKKTQKTPKSEIDKAIKLKNEYYEHK